MTYITVDVELDDVLHEFDTSEVVEYVYYNYNNTEVFCRYDYEVIREYLIEEADDFIIADIDTLYDMLDPTCDPYLLKEWLTDCVKKQKGLGFNTKPMNTEEIKQWVKTNDI